MFQSDFAKSQYTYIHTYSSILPSNILLHILQVKKYICNLAIIRMEKYSNREVLSLDTLIPVTTTFYKSAWSDMIHIWQDIVY